MQRDNNDLLRIALMGALTGGAIGGGAKFLGGAKSLKELIKPTLIGGAIGGGAAGATNVAGRAIMGEPTEGESNANARRGLVGGLLLGALGGGTLGGLAGAGKMPAILKRAGSIIGQEIPLDNMATRKIAELAGKPGGAMKGATIGATLGAVPMAYEGFDEGTYYDTIQEEIAKERKRQMIEQMMMEQYGV